MGEPTEQETGGGGINPGFLAGREGFVVLTQAAIAPQPGEGPFHHPAPFEDPKPRWERGRLLSRGHPDIAQPRIEVLHHLDPPAQLSLDPLHEAPLVAPIDPQQRQAHEDLIQPGEQRLGAVGINLVGRMDADFQQPALRLDEVVALATGELLGAVIATWPPFSVVLTD